MLIEITDTDWYKQGHICESLGIQGLTPIVRATLVVVLDQTDTTPTPSLADVLSCFYLTLRLHPTSRKQLCTLLIYLLKY